MKRHMVIAIGACSLALTACTPDADSSSRPTPPPASTSQPTLSAAEAKKLAAEGEAARKAAEKEVQNRVAAIEKAVKMKASPTDRLSIIITAYCKIARDPDEVEKTEISLLEGLYAKYWQAGRWNKGLVSAAEQPGACPGTRSRFEG